MIMAILVFMKNGTLGRRGLTIKIKNSEEFYPVYYQNGINSSQMIANYAAGTLLALHRVNDTLYVFNAPALVA